MNEEPSVAVKVIATVLVCLMISLLTHWSWSFWEAPKLNIWQLVVTFYTARAISSLLLGRLVDIKWR